MIETESNQSKAFGLARDQGKRATCLAFAASDLNAVAHRLPHHLSVEYLCHHAALKVRGWSPDDGFGVDVVLAAVRAPGQPPEAQYPYRPDEPLAPLTTPPTVPGPRYTGMGAEPSWTSAEVFNRVRAGQPVGIVVSVSRSMMKPVSATVAFDPFRLPNVYHALIGVGTGFDRRSGEPHLLVRNSWGSAWGLDGHAWMPERHLAVHFHGCFTV